MRFAYCALHGLQRGWRGLQRAVEKALSDPANRTPDMGGEGTTDGVAGAVVAALE
jgi:isocitrate/isopropylmalate dehydrogenase